MVILGGYVFLMSEVPLYPGCGLHRAFNSLCSEQTLISNTLAPDVRVRDGLASTKWLPGMGDTHKKVLGVGDPCKMCLFEKGAWLSCKALEQLLATLTDTFCYLKLFIKFKDRYNRRYTSGQFP